MSLRAKRIIEAFAISLTVVSCVQDVILDAGDEPQVVVDCILTDEPVQTLRLVYTKGASKDKAPDLPEAMAVLTDLTEGREAGRFARTSDGSWQLAYTAIPAHDYRLDISVPGHDPIWAEQTMPEAPGIIVSWHSWSPGNRENPEGDNNIGYSFRFLRMQDPVWFYGVNFATMDSPGEQALYLSTNSQVVDSFNEVDGWSFTEESKGNYLWGSENSSGMRTTAYPALETAPRFKHYLRFPAMDDAPESPFYISGSFRGYISDYKNFMHAEVRSAELRYFSASEDYDTFLKDSYHLLDLKTSTDLADIFVRDNVFSNIHGAIGLFGAKMEKKLEWEGKDTWQASGYFIFAQFVKSFTYNDSNYVMGSFLASKPFKLLHFECWDVEKPRPTDPEPEWLPRGLTAGIDLQGDTVIVGTSAFSLNVIQDQEQLDECGIGDCGDIDFTREKVLVLAILFQGETPFLIGFGNPGSYNWPSGKSVPIILYSRISDDKLWKAVRYALLVDKDEQIADHMTLYSEFSHYVFFHPERNLRLIDGLTWNLP